LNDKHISQITRNVELKATRRPRDNAVFWENWTSMQHRVIFDFDDGFNLVESGKYHVPLETTIWYFIGIQKIGNSTI
jgi:hypothetical protein